MPLVFEERGFRFHFYSNEGDPREPVHIHVAKAGADAKLWLYPDVVIAYTHGFNAQEQRWFRSVVESRRAEIESVWNEHFSASD